MIELKVDDFRDGNVTFHISRQDKEDYERLRCKPFILKLSDGKDYFLRSISSPEYFENYLKRGLYVRGGDVGLDNMKIMVTFTEFLKIFELLKAYNKIS